MSTPQIILWIVAFVVGFPAAFRNPTAFALVLCFLFSEGLCAYTGNGLATEYFLLPDFFVIAVIFAKTEACNLKPYINTWHKLKCIVLERSIPDRIVMLTFAAMWWVYAEPHGHFQWMALFYLALVQFAAAGWEGLSKIYRSCVTSGTPDYPSGDVFRRLVWSRGYG